MKKKMNQLMVHFAALACVTDKPRAAGCSPRAHQKIHQGRCEGQNKALYFCASAGGNLGGSRKQRMD